LNTLLSWTPGEENQRERERESLPGAAIMSVEVNKELFNSRLKFLYDSWKVKKKNPLLFATHLSFFS